MDSNPAPSEESVATPNIPLDTASIDSLTLPTANTPAVEVPVTEAVETPVEAPVETPEVAAETGTEAPVAEVTTEVAPEEAPEFTAIEKEAIELRTAMAKAGTPITLADAISRTEAKYTLETGDPEPTDEPPVATRSQTLQTEVDGLRARMREIAKDSPLFGEEIAELTITLSEKQAELKAEQAAENAIGHADGRSIEVAQEANKAVILQKYPDAADTGSPLGAMVAAEVADLRAKIAAGGPEGARARAILRSHDAPSIVTEQAAEKFAKALSVTMNVPLERARQMITAKVPGTPATPAAPVKDGPKPPPRALNVTASGAAAAAPTAPAVDPAQYRRLLLTDPDAAAALVEKPSQSLTFGKRY